LHAKAQSELWQCELQKKHNGLRGRANSTARQKNQDGNPLAERRRNGYIFYRWMLPTREEKQLINSENTSKIAQIARKYTVKDEKEADKKEVEIELTKDD
jgi:hypothetical protein